MLSLKKLRALNALLHEYAQDSYACGFPCTARAAAELVEVIAEEIAENSGVPGGKQ